MEQEKIIEILDSNRYLMKEWFFGCCEQFDNGKYVDNNFINSMTSVLNGKCYIWIVVAFNDNAVVEIVKQMETFHKVVDLLKKHKCNVEPFLEKNAFSFFVQSDLNERQTAEYATVVAQNIRDTLNKNNSLDYGIGIGRAGKDFGKVREAYILAEEASKYRYAQGMGKIIHISDVEPDMRVNDYHAVREADFRTSIKVGNEEMNYEIVTDIFGHIKRSNDPLDIAKRIALELLVSANRAIYELGRNPAILFDKTDIWSVINRCKDVDQLYELILNTSQLVIMRIFQRETPKEKTIVEKAKRIIDEDSAERVSLESVAKKIYISPCYLSMVFSRETGTTFKDYLINARIARAKGLLHDPTTKIYNVAKAVGYSDARYFSDLFKKRVGVTPAEYRKNLLTKN
ncbi:MAG: AraC family transcriptional regulator [Eubacteriales bacterium]|nr:AraC family transcriptional regulator [Eubacteriales bacterium]